MKRLLFAAALALAGWRDDDPDGDTDETVIVMAPLPKPTIIIPEHFCEGGGPECR